MKNTSKRRLADNAHVLPSRGSYGRLVIERDLTKDEVEALERALSVPNRPPALVFDGWKIYVYDVNVDHKERNVSYLTVKGIV
jgi:hypothetical protein